jgi:hypothetical protein
MDNVAFIQSGSGTLTIIIGQESFTVATDHPNYFNILNSLEDRNADHLKELIDVPTSVQNYSEGNIRIQEGLFLYEGEELHNTLTERLMKLMVAGHPYQYIVNFLDNLMDNPSGRAVKELYTFLENRSLPITEDGCFLAYKSVREDFMDWFSNSIDNSVGQIVKMKRNRVDDNCDVGCSQGLHAGAIDYVSDYHGNDDDSHVVIVKINPRDVVSVPLDHDCTKVRVCEYEVVDEYEGELKEVLYRANVGNVEHIIGMFDNQSEEHWYMDYTEDLEMN